MSAWRTSCPRLPLWEEANDRGFTEITNADGRKLIRLTPAGIAFLKDLNSPAILHPPE